MKDLKELGFNPIEAEQAQEINGGIEIKKERIIFCCIDIPPMTSPLEKF